MTPAPAPVIRSPWSGLRNVLLVGGLALGLSIALAMTVEHTVAARHCIAYGSARQLQYQHLNYPSGGGGDYTSTCIFTDSAGAQRRASFSKIGAGFVTDLFVTLSLEIGLTAGALFVLIALLAVGFKRLLSGKTARPRV